MDPELSLQVLRDLTVGVLVQGADASIRFANAAALDLLGLTEDELLGRTSFDPTWNVVHHDGSPFPGDTHPVPVAIATRRPVTDVLMGVWRPRRKDRVWLMVAAHPRLDAEGAVVDCLCTFSDITLEHERHRIVIDRADVLERAVAERTAELTRTVAQLSREIAERAKAEARFTRVTDAVPGVLIELSQRDHGWETTFASGQAGPVLGLALDELREDTDRLFGQLHPEDADTLRRRLGHGSTDRAVLDLEVRVRRADDWGWARVYAVPERSVEGLRWTGFLTDVTDEHRLAEGLRQTQRREAMASLSAGVAHNFNNMLAAILPNLDLALQDTIGTEAEAPLRDAFSAAESAASLVRQLLLASRGETDERRVGLDLRVPLREAVDICRRTFYRNIAVSLDLPDAPMPVLGTASLLHQVFLNVLLNARDAVEDQPDAKITVVGGVEHPTGVPGVLTITFEDNGIGMPPEVLARLGEPFFTTKDVGRGTGLGIPMIYGIVADLDGSVAVRSTEGVGTQFVVELPLAEGLDIPARGPRAPDAATRGRRVLVVDDEPLVRRTLARMLEGLGLSVVLAEDGYRALELARDDIDVVLLDLSMPGLTGARVLERLETLAPDLPVIIITGFLDMVQGIGRAHTVLQKPVHRDELARVLSEVWDER